MSPVEAVLAARPGRRVVASRSDEVVLVGGGEVLRAPLTVAAAARHRVLVAALPVLRALVPVPVAPPRYVGVLTDGETPFTAEDRLPGLPATTLGTVAAGQLAGAVAALLAVSPRQAQQWGVPGEGRLLHGALSADAVLVDPVRGVVTGLVGWDLRLGEPGSDIAPDLAAALG